jgi:tetratricopeptide (TPR) repeat protein
VVWSGALRLSPPPHYTRRVNIERDGLRLVILLPVLLLSACAGSQGTHRIWTEDRPGVVGAPVESAPRPEAEPLPQSREIVQPPTAADISGAAVTSLMRQARVALDGGRPEQAAAALERALRIEPRNYFVWAMLGQTYLAQQNYEQADSVAAKSNALARGNGYAELQNWRTIAEARSAMGDAAGAGAAAQRVRELEQRLAAYPAASSIP